MKKIKGLINRRRRCRERGGNGEGKFPAYIAIKLVLWYSTPLLALLSSRSYNIIRRHRSPASDDS